MAAAASTTTAGDIRAWCEILKEQSIIGDVADSHPSCPHTARHYWGPRKPWQLEKDNAGRVAVYLEQTSFEGLPRASASMCAQRFASWGPRLAGARAFLVNRTAKLKRNNGKLQRLR